MAPKTKKEAAPTKGPAKKGDKKAEKGDKTKPEVDKALKVKKTIAHKHSQRKRKIRTIARFRRPKTFKPPRNPRFASRSVPKREKMDSYRLIKYPITTESAMKKIEEHNTLVFVVDIKATKPLIKAAVKKLYDIQAVKINTLIGPTMEKKAYVKLDAQVDCLEVANTIGFI